MFFFGFTSLLIGYLEVAALAVLRTVTKAMDREIMKLHPKDFTLTHVDVWFHLPSYATVDQVFFYLRNLQHSKKKLIPHMPLPRTVRRELTRGRAYEYVRPTREQLVFLRYLGLGNLPNSPYPAVGHDVFCTLFGHFRRNAHTSSLVLAATKFDSVSLLRLIANEVITQT
jgi:hypothetical protein